MALKYLIIYVSGGNECSNALKGIRTAKKTVLGNVLPLPLNAVVLTASARAVTSSTPIPQQ